MAEQKRSRATTRPRDSGRFKTVPPVVRHPTTSTEYERATADVAAFLRSREITPDIIHAIESGAHKGLADRYPPAENEREECPCRYCRDFK